jgi:hypothetical protein
VKDDSTVRFINDKKFPPDPIEPQHDSSLFTKSREVMTCFFLNPWIEDVLVAECVTTLNDYGSDYSLLLRCHAPQYWHLYVFNCAGPVSLSAILCAAVAFASRSLAYMRFPDTAHVRG